MSLVEVSKHAVDQHEERWPDPPRPRTEHRREVTVDIVEAMVAGRSSAKEPAFTNHGSLMTRVERKQKLRRRQGRDRHVRFVWTEDRERVYLIERRDGAIFVITSIRVRDTALTDG